MGRRISARRRRSVVRSFLVPRKTAEEFREGIIEGGVEYVETLLERERDLWATSIIYSLSFLYQLPLSVDIPPSFYSASTD